MKPRNNQFISISIADCEVVFEEGGKEEKPASGFLFEYNKSQSLTDRLVHVQNVDPKTGIKTTDLFIERRLAGGIPGAGTASRIPLLRITSQ